MLQILKPRYEQHSREKFCKRDGLPKPLYVGHDLLLSFVSSHNLSLSGSSSSFGGPPKKFKFRLERARGHGCGGVLLAGMSSTTSSYIQSPNYDDSSNTIKTGKQYANNIECVWEVRSFPDFHLEFNFNSRFDIENSANCTNDFVLFEEKQLAFVGDTEVESWKVLNRLCGHNTPTRVVSSTNFVRVTFRTNDKVVGDGFRAQFKHACGGNLFLLIVIQLSNLFLNIKVCFKKILALLPVLDTVKALTAPNCHACTEFNVPQMSTLVSPLKTLTWNTIRIAILIR